MKLAKAIKKLKFWPRKKKKIKFYIIDHHPPPPPTFNYCHSWFPVQPSAPPLPPWFDHEQTLYSNFSPDSDIASSSQAEFISTPEEIAPDLNSTYQIPAVSNNTSYQQYLVPNPEYGVPLLPAVRKKMAAGFFGFVLSIGRHWFHCFCPCFHIRE